jgi:hypothetical protein
LKHAKLVIARRPQANAGNPETNGFALFPWIATAALRPRDDITETFSTACSHVCIQVCGRDFSIRRSGGCRLRDAHGRRQDPKTPVEQALMRGLVTA